MTSRGELPKGVQRVRKRLADGSEAVYLYWRATGKKLPNSEDPGFNEAVEAARRGVASKDEPPAKSVGALIRAYKRSPGWRTLRPATQRQYENNLDKLPDEAFRRQVSEIKRSHIILLRDAISVITDERRGGPAAANSFVATMRTLFAYAVDMDWREANPARDIPQLAGGHYARWTEKQIAYAITPGVLPERFRRAIVVALYTGQRRGDCLAMRWGQYDGTAISLVQVKTGATLWVPVHRALKIELDRWREEGPDAEAILTDQDGDRWGDGRFTASLKYHLALPRHKVLAGAVFHGLRKAAAARLAEAGCSTHEIAAITGHSTLAMVELYTKEADQRGRARSAMGKLELVSSGPKPKL